MAYKTRAYGNEHGEPIVVMVVDGNHDVSRLVAMLNRGNCEQGGVGEKLLRQLRRHNGGCDALALLKAHGGPDFTEDAPDPLTITQPFGDPYAYIVNGSFSIHDFANDPAWEGERVADRWGYYLPHPWPGWVTGFTSKEGAALAGILAIRQGIPEAAS